MTAVLLINRSLRWRNWLGLALAAAFVALVLAGCFAAGVRSSALESRALPFGVEWHLLPLGLAVWSSPGRRRRLLRACGHFNELASGKLPEPVPRRASDAIARLDDAACRLAEYHQRVAAFARRIEAGDWDAPFEPLGPDDALGQALAAMQTSLVRRREENESRALSRRAELESKAEKLLDSILYAQRIQRIVLPNLEQVRRYLPQHFIFFRPRDIVSGDFYWFHCHRNQVIAVAADCTGHGVPGAFMSLLGTTALNQVLRDYGKMGAHLILAEMNQRISALLKQGYSPSGEESPSLDGMDLAMVYINLRTLEVQFAGAGRPMHYFHKGRLYTLKGDKHSIGGASLLAENVEFTKKDIRLEAGDTLYLFSDGVTDQFNAKSKKKLGHKRLCEWLEGMQGETMERQHELFCELMDGWQGDAAQTDDMLLLGVRL